MANLNISLNEEGASPKWIAHTICEPIPSLCWYAVFCSLGSLCVNPNFAGLALCPGLWLVAH